MSPDCILPLHSTAITIIIHTLLDRDDAHSQQNRFNGRLIIRQLQSNLFAAVSTEILVKFAKDHPSSLTPDLLLVLAPPHLRSLNLKQCHKIGNSDEAIAGFKQTLLKCAHLQSLILDDIVMSHGFYPMMEMITEAAPQITSVSLEGTSHITDHDVQILLRGLPSLNSINLAMCGRLTDYVFVLGEGQLKSSQSANSANRPFPGSNLVSVNLAGCQQLTSTCVRHLLELCGPMLQNINVSCTGMDCTLLWYMSGYSLSTAVQLAVQSHKQTLHKESEAGIALDQLLQDFNMLRSRLDEIEVEEKNARQPDIVAKDDAIGERMKVVRDTVVGNEQRVRNSTEREHVAANVENSQNINEGACSLLPKSLEIVDNNKLSADALLADIQDTSDDIKQEENIPECEDGARTELQTTEPASLKIDDVNIVVEPQEVREHHCDPCFDNEVGDAEHILKCRRLKENTEGSLNDFEEDVILGSRAPKILENSNVEVHDDDENTVLVSPVSLSSNVSAADFCSLDGTAEKIVCSNAAAGEVKDCDDHERKIERRSDVVSLSLDPVKDVPLQLMLHQAGGHGEIEEYCKRSDMLLLRHDCEGSDFKLYHEATRRGNVVDVPEHSEKCNGIEPVASIVKSECQTNSLEIVSFKTCREIEVVGSCSSDATHSVQYHSQQDKERTNPSLQCASEECRASSVDHVTNSSIYHPFTAIKDGHADNEVYNEIKALMASTGTSPSCVASSSSENDIGVTVESTDMVGNVIHHLDDKETNVIAMSSNMGQDISQDVSVFLTHLSPDTENSEPAQGAESLCQCSDPQASQSDSCVNLQKCNNEDTPKSFNADVQSTGNMDAGWWCYNSIQLAPTFDTEDENAKSVNDCGTKPDVSPGTSVDNGEVQCTGNLDAECSSSEVSSSYQDPILDTKDENATSLNGNGTHSDVLSSTSVHGMNKKSDDILHEQEGGNQGITKHLDQVPVSHNASASVSTCLSHACANVSGGTTWSRLYDPKITSLDISNIDFDETLIGMCLEEFFAVNRSLQKLVLSQRGLSDSMLEIISRNSGELRFVSLFDCCEISNEGLAAFLRKCPKLQHLDIQGMTHVGDRGLLPLFQMGDNSRIGVLKLTETAITDFTLARIARAMGPKLVELELLWCEDMTDAGLHHIAMGCPSLKTLLLRQRTMTPDTLLALSQNCTGLENLGLSGISCMMDDVVETMVQRLGLLHTLDVSWNTDLTNNAVSAILSWCPQMSKLLLMGLKRITDKPFLPIISQYSKWKRCQTLIRLKLKEKKSGMPQHSSDEEYEDLYIPVRSTSYAPSLQYLNLGFCDHVNDNRLEEIVAVCRGTLEITDYYGEQIAPKLLHAS